MAQTIDPVAVAERTYQVSEEEIAKWVSDAGGVLLRMLAQDTDAGPGGGQHRSREFVVTK